MKYLIQALCLFFTLISSASIANSQYEDMSQLINVWLDAQKDYDDIPSISGVIVQDQQVIWSGSFGESNRETGQAISLNAMGSICSVSKVFTATAIMKLVDNGKLSLDSKLHELLPKLTLKQAFPEGGDITIKALLTHSSGVPRDTEHAYWSSPAHHFPSEQELYQSLSATQTIHAVGSSIAYSNVGYALLGQVIEQVSGKSYKDFIETEIFSPLRMQDSTVELPQPLIGNRHTVGYTAKSRGGDRKRADLYQTRSMQSAAGISSTVMDLAKFTMWQFREVKSDKKEIMSSSSLLSMYEPHAKNQRGSRGYGYAVTEDKDSNRWVTHGGMCPGYVSFLKIDVSNKMAYAIMVNANKVRAMAYVNGLIELMTQYTATSDGDIRKENQTLSDFVGFYDLTPWNSEYYVAKWKQDLMLLYLPADSLNYALYQYRQVADDRFQLIENGKFANEHLVFIRDESGKVFKVKNEGNFHWKIPPTKISQ